MYYILFFVFIFKTKILNFEFVFQNSKLFLNFKNKSKICFLLSKTNC